MCISNTSNVKPVIVTGYVVRRITYDYNIYPEYYGVFISGYKSQCLGKWMKASEYSGRRKLPYYNYNAVHTEFYEAGWHVLRTKKEAFRFFREYIDCALTLNPTYYKVLKVQVSGHIASGYQESTNFEVSVFKRIKLIKEVTE
jgi:hypothetical protein